MGALGNARVVVVGNVKGGSGKSTVAVHLAIALMNAGQSVVCVDADVHQHSLARFLENRRENAARTGRSLPMPEFATFDREPGTIDHRLHAEARRLIERLGALNSLVIIDTAGSDTNLSRTVHGLADAVVTPVNDSFVDLDVLGRVEVATDETDAGVTVTDAGVYTRQLLAARERRQQCDRQTIDWIVLRNRLSHLDARNKRVVGAGLRALGERFGFRVAEGFGERVIFRELFSMGLTVFDLGTAAGGRPMTLSHVAARQEVRGLIGTLRLGNRNAESFGNATAA